MDLITREATLPLLTRIDGLETEKELLTGQVDALTAENEDFRRSVKAWRIVGTIGIGVSSGVVVFITLSFIFPDLITE